MRTDLSTFQDEQLLQSVAESSEDAFRELYERYERPLFTKAVYFLGCQNSAKDCLHDVFISIWVKRESLTIENLHSYLHQAIRFRALKYLRSSRSTKYPGDEFLRLTDHVLASDLLEYRELCTNLQTGINALPPGQRQIFLLHRDHGLTYAQIAARLSISVKTVEKKMSLSLQHLRRYKLSAV
jgi:RNA polymerase sigma-70 factor (family 1)